MCCKVRIAAQMWDEKDAAHASKHKECCVEK
jgi:hypothetical protein